MNRYTLEKLAKNPHYKLSAAQKKLLDEQAEPEREPIVEFGGRPTHNTHIEKHDVVIRKRKRT